MQPFLTYDILPLLLRLKGKGCYYIHHHDKETGRKGEEKVCMCENNDDKIMYYQAKHRALTFKNDVYYIERNSLCKQDRERKREQKYIPMMPIWKERSMIVVVVGFIVVSCYVLFSLFYSSSSLKKKPFFSNRFSRTSGLPLSPASSSRRFSSFLAVNAPKPFR